MNLRSAALAAGIFALAVSPALAEFEERPTQSLTGETGYFYVLTAGGLCARQISVQAAVDNFDVDPGSIDYTQETLAFAYGLTNKLEVSLTFRAAQIDVRQDPAEPDAYFRGKILTGPYEEEGRGNTRMAIKWNFLTERRGRIGLAAHAFIEVPSAHDESLRGTGKTDSGTTLIASKRFGWLATSANVGFVSHGDPTYNDTTYPVNDWITYGFGVRFPVNKPVQVIGEVWGYSIASYETVTPELALATGLPAGSDIPDEDRTYFHLGAQWQIKGFTFSAGGRYTDMNDTRPLASTVPDNNGWGYMAKISYTGPCRVREESAPDLSGDREPETKMPAPEVVMQNLPPTLTLEPEMFSVRPGESITLRGLGHDPEGESLLYGWDPERGRVTGDGASVRWQAPEDCDKPVVIRAKVTDPHGATGIAETVIRVICPETKVSRPLPAEDYRIFFEFNRFAATDAAEVVLNRVYQHMTKNKKVTVVIEGHTCNIGTERYNLALGQRRAETARHFLILKGIAPDRIRAVTYGLARPAYSNLKEETRKLNRRCDFVFEDEKK